MDNGHSQDVSISVDPALGGALALAGPVPTAEEVIQMQAAMIAELQGKNSRQEILGAQCIHVAIAMAALLIEHGYGLDTHTVVVPYELRKRYEGGHLTISEGPDASYLMKIRTRNEPEDVSIARES